MPENVLDGKTALGTQVGGSHYKDMKIQPVEFIHANGIGFLEGCIIKRICRWRSKDGVKDLEKIKHEVDLLIELHQRDNHISDLMRGAAQAAAYNAPAHWPPTNRGRYGEKL